MQFGGVIKFLEGAVDSRAILEWFESGMGDELPGKQQIDWKRAGLLILGTVLFALYLGRLDWDAVKQTRNVFPVGVAALVISLNLLTGILKYGRWSRLLEKRGIDRSGGWLDEYLAINAGFFLGLVTPGTSGELARSALSDVPSSRALAIIGFEKISDFGVLLLMVAGSAIVQFTSGFTSWVVSGAIVSGTLGAYVLFRRFDRLVTWPLRFLIERFGDSEQVTTARSVYWEFYELLGDRRALVFSAFFSALLWTLPVVQMHLILTGLGGDIPFKTSAFVFLLPYLIGILSMIPAGIGAFDIATDQIGGRAITMAGAAGAFGTLAPLYFRVFVTVPLIILGYVCHIILDVRRRKVVAQ